MMIHPAVWDCHTQHGHMPGFGLDPKLNTNPNKMRVCRHVVYGTPKQQGVSSLQVSIHGRNNDPGVWNYSCLTWVTLSVEQS
jgi:hypothetical protein